MIARTAKLQEEIIAHYDHYQLHQIYQKLHNFCVVDLGGFYLDIIKDRQYTAKTDGLPRRSAQTAMYYIVSAFTRWITPILSFTADEIWQALPGEKAENVFVSNWQELPEIAASSFDDAFWFDVLAVKNAVNKAIELKRNEGQIGGALAAEVTLYCDDKLKAVIERIESELRFVLITSKATVKPISEADEQSLTTEIDGLKVSVNKTEAQKCARCWHHQPSVGENAEHPELCNRCVTNIQGKGEVRLYA